jgi:HrpA-like RNA helicase
MSPATPPAIHLSELSGEVLRLKSLGFEDIHKFDWLDPLHPEPYLRAISDLRVMCVHIEHRFATPLIGQRVLTIRIGATSTISAVSLQTAEKR